MKRRKNSVVSAMARKGSNEAKGKANESKTHEHYPYFANVPDSLTIHILLQLPIKSLLICKFVCKNWKTLISQPHFAKLHFKQAKSCFIIQASDDYRRVSTTLYHVESDLEKFEIRSDDHVEIEPVLKFPNAESIMKKNGENDNGGNQRLELEILNSCNGLLCLYDLSNRNPLVICNPITREFIRLPKARTNDIVAAGFGFQPKTNEYKVIRIKGGWTEVNCKYVWEGVRAILEIHTVGTLSWKNVKIDPKISISNLRCPTCINGALHWMKIDNGQISILCFNFESERLQSFPSPPSPLHVLGNHTTLITTMGESRGFLYICERPSINNVTMWFMKNYGIGESWTKVYNIDVSVEHIGLSQPYGGCWPIKHFEEGVAVFLHYYAPNCFVYFDPKKYGSKKFQIHGISHSKFIKVISHIPSLISLKDVVKGENVEVLDID